MFITILSFTLEKRCVIRSVGGVNSVVECQLPKLNVAGSSPVPRSSKTDKRSLSVSRYARVAAFSKRRSGIG